MKKICPACGHKMKRRVRKEPKKGHPDIWYSHKCGVQKVSVKVGRQIK